MSKCIEIVSQEEVAIPVDLNHSLAPTVVGILQNEIDLENDNGILVCLTCLSSLCVYRFSFVRE